MEKRKVGTSSDGRKMHYSAGIMLECNGKYFLMERRNPPPGFACPAGHIDEGEDSVAAGRRELQEETGITATELYLLAEEEIPWNYCKDGTEVHYWYLFRYSMTEETAVADIGEAKSSGWYSPEEIKKLTLEEVWAYWFKKLNII